MMISCSGTNLGSCTLNECTDPTDTSKNTLAANSGLGSDHLELSGINVNAAAGGGSDTLDLSGDGICAWGESGDDTINISGRNIMADGGTGTDTYTISGTFDGAGSGPSGIVICDSDQTSSDLIIDLDGLACSGGFSGVLYQDGNMLKIMECGSGDMIVLATIPTATGSVTTQNIDSCLQGCTAPTTTTLPTSKYSRRKCLV